MSNMYTHKIILFTKNDFSGDALVVLDNTIEVRDSIKDLSKIGWDNKIKSAISEKGGWELCTQVNDNYGSQRVIRGIHDKDCRKQDSLDNVNRLQSTLKI